MDPFNLHFINSRMWRHPSDPRFEQDHCSLIRVAYHYSLIRVAYHYSLISGAYPAVDFCPSGWTCQNKAEPYDPDGQYVQIQVAEQSFQVCVRAVPRCGGADVHGGVCVQRGLHLWGPPGTWDDPPGDPPEVDPPGTGGAARCARPRIRRGCGLQGRSVYLSSYLSNFSVVYDFMSSDTLRC